MTELRDSDSAATTDVLFRDWARQSGVFSAQPDAPVVPDRPRRGAGVHSGWPSWLGRAAPPTAAPDRTQAASYPVGRPRCARIGRGIC